MAKNLKLRALPAKGNRFKDDAGSIVRVMAVSEGWVMYRHHGCVPMVKHYKEFDKEFHIRVSDQSLNQIANQIKKDRENEKTPDAPN